MDAKNGNPHTITAFDCENIVWHIEQANRRMLIALLAVCLTFIITILVFVHGYTVREKNWLDMLHKTTVTEVDNAIQQQSYP